MSVLEQVKEQLALEVEVERLTGLEGKRSGRALMWNCPLPGHADRTASFAVFPESQTWTCYGACGAHGDIFDLYVRLFQVTTQEALALLRGQVDVRLPPKERAAAPAARPAPGLTAAKVMGYHRQRAETARYFHDQRAISLQSIDDFALGTQLAAQHTYTFLDGHEETFRHRRYIIPWRLGDRYYQLSKRRDDHHCRRQMAQMPQTLERLRTDIVARAQRCARPLAASDVTDDDLLEAAFGPKYKRYAGAAGRIFNLEQIFALDFVSNQLLLGADGLPIVHRLEYLLINESPISAISEIDLGYPAVGYSFDRRVNYRHAFSGVCQPVILADNDGGPGLKKAHQLAEAIGNPNTCILVTPGLKDPNELIVADQQDQTARFAAWMRKAGLAPLFQPKGRPEPDSRSRARSERLIAV